MQEQLPIAGSYVEDQTVIMVIDDSTESLKLLTAILSKQGFGVRQALTGRAALVAIVQRLPDLIILDVRMPEMDGLEVCRILKSDSSTADIPIIFISGLKDSEDKVLAFNAGGLDYITKPFHEEEVLARVNLHLSMSKMRQNLEELVQRRTVKLKESNTALQVLLDHRQAEREKFEESVVTNINSLVTPYLKRLKESELNQHQIALTEVIELNLAEITSHFSGKLYAKVVGLTRREMEVAALIKMSKTNHEIADILCISDHVVSFHRQNLRKKLGLLGQKVNLVAYLNEITIK